jgi:hypothetical protein
MSQFVESMRMGVKNSSSSLMLWSLKMISGLILGLTLALIGEEMMGYQSLSFFFVLIVTALVFLRTSKPWGVGGVLIFDLIAVLIGLILRMYLLIAPGL